MTVEELEQEISALRGERQTLNLELRTLRRQVADQQEKVRGYIAVVRNVRERLEAIQQKLTP